MDARRTDGGVAVIVAKIAVLQERADVYYHVIFHFAFGSTEHADDADSTREWHRNGILAFVFVCSVQTSYERHACTTTTTVVLP